MAWVVAGAGLLAAAPQPAGAQSYAGTGENAALYEKHCAVCHGADLRGRMGISLVDDEWTHGGSDAEIMASIGNGRGEMPGFAKVLSEREIRALVFYIRERKRLAEIAGPPQTIDPETVLFRSRNQDFRLQKVTESNTGSLWSLNFLPDGRMIVPEKNGRLWLVDPDGSKVSIRGTPEVLVSGDAGMLEVTPHPDYARNGWLYMAYVTGRRGEAVNVGGTTSYVHGATRIARGRIRNGEWVDQQTLFEVRPEHAEMMTMRFGSRILLRDGYLFFSIGDGGSMDLAQDLSTPFAKVFRLHDDGRVPADNPFVKVPGAYAAIWTYGNRNVQGMALQPRTGLLVATEHGPRGGDEVNALRKGANHGWPVVTHGINYDGTVISDKTEAPGMVPPIHYWVPSIGVCGIDFYTGDRFPGWRGDLFVASLSGQELHRLRITKGKVTEQEIVLRGIGRLRDVVTGPDGTLYLVTNTRGPDAGRIYRMVPAKAN